MKIHGQAHVVDFWEYWKVLLSCFGPERHHLIMKRCMSFSYNKACRTALAYDVRIWIKNLQLPNLYEPAHLAGNIRTSSCDVAWPGVDTIVTISAWAGSLQTEYGMLCKGDLLQYTDADHQMLGSAIGFAKTNVADPRYVVFMHTCIRDPARAGAWRTQSHSISLVRALDIVGAVPYIKHDDYVVPLLHTTCR